MKGQKVFVVIGGWDYEGYSEPVGIYSTRAKAQDALLYSKGNHSYDMREIMEYQLDIGEMEAELAERSK